MVASGECERNFVPVASRCKRDDEGQSLDFRQSHSTWMKGWSFVASQRIVSLELTSTPLQDRTIIDMHPLNVPATYFSPLCSIRADY